MGAETMASISLRGICKFFPGNVAAVSDFSMEIEDKEFIVLVGPSGCGKSTVLRMIAGLEDISQGELYIGGQLVNNDVPPKDRNIAMVFQNYALYPHMNVYKNMAFALELRKMPRDEIKRRVQEAAQILNIEHLLDRKPKALSGGQRQRVALGRAMVRNPAVFLLDEPLSNLDAKLRASMRTELIKLHQRLGTTFIYVTHDQTEAMTMGNRIVVMKDGFIQQIDEPQNLYDHPLNIFVAEFIGTPQMNFLDGVLRLEKNSYRVEIRNDNIALDSVRVSDGLRAYVDKPVKAGIRPEDIYNEAEFVREHSGEVLKAEVEIIEHMGSDLFLYLKYGEARLIARAATNTALRTGDSLNIGIDTRKIHLFDHETGEAILI
jgi:multiple sugar transport system ATP-binding protein